MSSGAVPVGGEIDAWCTRCKRDLNHVIVAKLDGVVKKVQCLTCSGQHVYRAAGGGGSLAAAARPATGRPKAKPRRALPPDDGTRPGRAYRMSDGFRPGEIVEHPQYGRGRVVEIRGNKIDVEFTAGVKVLAHDPAAAAR